MTQTAQAPLFILAQQPTFEWPVKVRIPFKGKYLEAEFMAKFPNINQEALDELLGSDPAGKARYTDREIAEKVLLHFEDMPLPDGSWMSYSDENKVRLLDQPRVPASVVATFHLAVRGIAKEKND